MQHLLSMAVFQVNLSRPIASLALSCRVLSTLENLENSANLLILENSGKTRNLKYTPGILVFQMSFFCDAVCNTQQADM